MQLESTLAPVVDQQLSNLGRQVGKMDETAAHSRVFVPGRGEEREQHRVAEKGSRRARQPGRNAFRQELLFNATDGQGRRERRGRSVTDAGILEQRAFVVRDLEIGEV